MESLHFEHRIALHVKHRHEAYPKKKTDTTREVGSPKLQGTKREAHAAHKQCPGVNIYDIFFVGTTISSTLYDVSPTNSQLQYVTTPGQDPKNSV